MEKTTEIVPRITQLDAVEFDGSIREILSGEIMEIGKYLKPGLLTSYKPEIELIMDLLILKYSLFKEGSTFGQQLLNLTYNKIPKRHGAYFYTIVIAILPYMKKRYDESWRGSGRNMRTVVDILSSIGSGLHLINLLLFFMEGLHPTLVDRCFGLKHQLVQRLNRNVNYNQMTRELLWHGYMELFMLTKPLVNFQGLKRKIRSVFSRPVPKSQVSSPVLDSTTVCVVCACRPNVPCRISSYCQHVACYICLKGNIMADEKFCCTECGAQNTAVDNFIFIQC